MTHTSPAPEHATSHSASEQDSPAATKQATPEQATRERPYRVAVIGAGPAGIYASDILSKSDIPVSIDLFDKLPTPYGLVRYGVAPDHPRIGSIIKALHAILKRGDIRFLGNVKIGEDVHMSEIHEFYDAVVVATGADQSVPLDIPGADLPEVYGAADFVSWYDGHPDVPRTWPLNARNVAVIGVGNVALDISRILVRSVDDLRAHTDIPENVERGLRANPVEHVHIFGRRGPAQVKFTPLELRELSEVAGVDIQVYPEDFQYDAGSQEALDSSKMTRQVVDLLTDWVFNDPEEMTSPRRIHIHLMQAPVEILGTDHVTGIRMERTQLRGDGTVVGTGETVDYPVEAVYSAIGYASEPLDGLPWDPIHRVIPNAEGRIVTETGETIPGYYVTGWIKRGPVGLIGSTKSDARQTIRHLIADAQAGIARATGDGSGGRGLLDLLTERGVKWTTWEGWELLEAFEENLGAQQGRARVKVVNRDTMTAISRGESHDGALV